MAHLATQTFGDVLDHLADVIEGGNAYAGGTSWTGVPGTRSNDEGLRVGGDGSFVASGTPTTTTVQHPTGTWSQSRWVKTSTPGFFLVDGSQRAARRITAWNSSTKVFTTDAFPAAPAAGAAMTVRQGFKLAPNHVDIESVEAGAEGGYDRSFSLVLHPGRDLGLYGVGRMTKRGSVDVILRILTYDRVHEARQSAAENIALIQAALRFGGSGETPNHRDGTYIRAVLQSDSEVGITETRTRVIAKATLPVVYSIDLDYA